MNFTITIAIIAVTCLISIPAFNSDKIKSDLIFYPPAISQRKQWYRFITCGLIHADVPHLFFNMYTLYMFGDAVESNFIDIFGTQGKLLYIVMYVTALVACLLPTYFKHKDNAYYSSLGASGAIAAVVFAFIFLNPTVRMYLLFLPIPLPAFIFGVLYLVITSYLAKRGGSNINHSAHLWGSVYGVFFLLLMAFTIAQRNLMGEFLGQVTSYFQSF
jgi:membrane associated rhomboid family serine protease